jgi:cytochrome d ubiquinol oxidase subunit I
MEFSFGTNWEGFSTFAGGVFGLPVAIEAVTAFALEAGFIGILLFGRQRVSPRVYWLAAFLVFFGAHLSGLWIIAANTWMQVPTGFVVQNGRAVLTDFWQLLNAGTWLRFAHTLVACWMAGTGIIAGLAAWFFLQRRHEDFARRLLGPAAAFFIFLPIVQLGLGHLSADFVDHYQKVKSAAMEGIFQSQRHAPLLLFGIPDEKNRTIHWAIGIPGFLSFLVGYDTRTLITGLNDFPAKDWPPFNVVFTTYHLMVAIGMLSIGLGLAAAWLWWKKPLPGPRWFAYLLLGYIVLPYLAIELGWMSSEIGRQPWVIYGVQRTCDAVSSGLPLGQLVFSLAGFLLLYTFLFAIFLYAVFKIIRKGPSFEHSAGGMP